VCFINFLCDLGGEIATDHSLENINCRAEI